MLKKVNYRAFQDWFEMINGYPVDTYDFRRSDDEIAESNKGMDELNIRLARGQQGGFKKWSEGLKN